jgi:hypothetical protein
MTEMNLNKMKVFISTKTKNKPFNVALFPIKKGLEILQIKRWGLIHILHCLFRCTKVSYKIFSHQKNAGFDRSAANLNSNFTQITRDASRIICYAKSMEFR